MKIDKFLLLEFRAGSVGAVAQRFLSNREARGASSHHLVHLISSLRPFAVALDAVPLAKVSAAMVRDYVRSLHVRLAPATVRGHVLDIRLFLRWAGKRGFCSKKLSKRVLLPRAVSTRSAVAEGDVSAVVAHLVAHLRDRGLVYLDLFGNLSAAPAGDWGRWDWYALRDLVGLLFLYESGARVGELCGLGVAALGRVEGVDGGAAVAVMVYGKSGVRRRWVGSKWLQLARLWLSVRPCASDYLICELASGRPLSSHGFGLVLARLCGRVGVARFGPHALRHAAVRRVRAVGGVEVARLFIDHSAVSSTLNYSPVEDAELAEVSAATGWRGGWF